MLAEPPKAAIARITDNTNRFGASAQPTEASV